MTHSESLRTQLLSSMAWLPINQARLEKYGSAVLSRMKFNIALSPTERKQVNILTAGTKMYINFFIYFNYKRVWLKQ